jgi:hypothetical protein
MPGLVFLLGDKLLDRLRSATFAMLGAITAIGLILVALVLQQGWPSVFGGPLPGFSNGPPADEAVSAATGISAGGAASAPQSGVGDAPPRSGSGRGSDSAGSRGARGAHDVVAATPVSSSPADPAPVIEASPEPQAPLPAAEPPPVSTPPATSAPPAGAPVAGAGDGGDEDEGKRSPAAGSEKPAKSKDKVLANAKGNSPSKGPTAASKPKSSAPKPKAPGPKAPPPPVEEASVEAKLPPVSVPSKDEADPLPVEEKNKRD